MHRKTAVFLVLAMLASGFAWSKDDDKDKDNGNGRGRSEAPAQRTEGRGNAGHAPAVRSSDQGGAERRMPTERHQQIQNHGNNTNGQVERSQGHQQSQIRRQTQDQQQGMDRGRHNGNGVQRQGVDQGRHNGNVNARHERTISPAVRHLGIDKAPKALARSKVLSVDREHSKMNLPTSGPGGTSIKASAISRTNFSNNSTVRTHMTTVSAASFKSQINIYNRTEVVRGRYYWHTGSGYNYCHYYDPYGYHWYGWYWGGSYFWTRWYFGNWWWYDPVYYRWCYWHNGGWWWQDPSTTVIYVYDNGNYSNAYNETDADVSAQSSDSTKRFQSGDGSREVRLVNGDAFLYDTSGENLFKPVFLSSGVSGVKYSGVKNGKALHILLMMQDGTFETFDDQGNQL